MRLAIAVGLMLAGMVAFRCADFGHRLVSPDFVALAFGEGGDDAYYFFTVARNVAAGLSITVDGVHWTSGFQPLWLAVCALAFALAGDRGALALLYVASIGLWLGSTWLLVRFVRIARGGDLSPAAAVLIATLFLCSGQFAQHYVNGMDTGLALTLYLGLMVAFQRHLQGGPAGTARLAGLGLLCGLAMLARNDAFFLCGTLLVAMLVSGARLKPLREALLIVAIASVLVIPWLAYCQWAAGHLMPQSGIATSASLRGHPNWPSIASKLELSLVPLLLPGMRAFLDGHVVGGGVFVLIAGLVLWVLHRRDREPWITDRASRWTVLALAAACVPLFLYYAAFSAAIQFYERYFAPIGLLVVTVLSLLIARWVRVPLRPMAAGAGLLAASVAIGAQVYWTGRDFNLPFRSYIGDSVYAIVRSPFAGNHARLGFAESGRMGFLYPDRVVNLDGKMRADALRALTDGSFAQFLQSADLDFIILHDFDVAFFDRMVPGWRDGYVRRGTLPTDFYIFARER